MKVLLSGNEAIARGAWEAGCNVATAYPGTPSTEILENIGNYSEIYAEWSTNEKVAFDVACGASFAGARTLVAMKHVGLNVAADPFFVMPYRGVVGGFVIVSADDPGMWSSQNEQDNRWYALFGKIPMLEPSDSQEAKELTRLAFEISEKFDTPVLLRVTTRISHSKTLVELANRTEHTPQGYISNPQKLFVLPGTPNAKRHRLLIEERLLQLKEYSEKFNAKGGWKHVLPPHPDLGIITSGIAYQYAKEVFPDASFLKLSMTYPLPTDLITKFASKVKEVYVIEEGDPFLENQIKMLDIKVTGKEKVPICGELDQSVLKKNFNAGTVNLQRTPNLSWGLLPDIPKRPPVLCPGCPHRGVFYVLNKLKLCAMGDIGCYTLGGLPPFNAMDSYICMGASIGNAYGIEVATQGRSSRHGGTDRQGLVPAQNKVVAVLGDSTFFHTGVPSLINVAYNKGHTTVIILDNLTTAMTGHQEHPGTGKTLKGEKTPKILIENIAKACGIKNVYVIDPYDLKTTKEVISREVKRKEPSVVIARRPCALNVAGNPPLKVNPEICTGCKLCMGLGCPAMKMSRNCGIIESTLCNGCGLCSQVCLKRAIS